MLDRKKKAASAEEEVNLINRAYAIGFQNGQEHQRGVCYAVAYDDFEMWWKRNYLHCDIVLRGMAAAAFMAARGYDLSGKKLIIE